MPEPTPQIIFVTPVWNDSTRLANYGESLAAAFAATELPIQWVIADDGSGPDEIERLESLKSKFSTTFSDIHIHAAKAHRGKGAVIREAWGQYPDADWLSFADADGSVNASDMLKLIHQALKSQSSVLGIRKRTENTHITESLYRSFFHNGFLLAAHLILGLQCDDPQCGAKVISGKDFRSVSHLLEEDGFAFDSELLSNLNHKGASWTETPVNWEEKGGGKVKPIKDGWLMFKALLRIRNRLD